MQLTLKKAAPKKYFGAAIKKSKKCLSATGRY